MPVSQGAAKLRRFINMELQMSIRQLIEAFGGDVDTIRDFLEDAGLVYPSRKAFSEMLARAVRNIPDLEAAIGAKLFREQEWTTEEREFLRDYWAEMTDSELAVKLGRSPDSVAKQRQRLRLLRNPGGKPLMDHPS